MPYRDKDRQKEYHEKYRTSPERRAKQREYMKTYNRVNAVRLREEAKQRATQNFLYHKDNHLKHLYGITLEEFHTMIRLQGYVCVICLELFDMKFPSNSGKRPCVDHNHETGSVRGVLCAACNRGLGLLHDSPEFLRRAANYIELRSGPLAGERE